MVFKILEIYTLLVKLNNVEVIFCSRTLPRISLIYLQFFLIVEATEDFIQRLISMYFQSSGLHPEFSVLGWSVLTLPS